MSSRPKIWFLEWWRVVYRLSSMRFSVTQINVTDVYQMWQLYLKTFFLSWLEHNVLLFLYDEYNLIYPQNGKWVASK